MLRRVCEVCKVDLSVVSNPVATQRLCPRVIDFLILAACIDVVVNVEAIDEKYSAYKTSASAFPLFLKVTHSILPVLYTPSCELPPPHTTGRLVMENFSSCRIDNQSPMLESISCGTWIGDGAFVQISHPKQITWNRSFKAPHSRDNRRAKGLFIHTQG